MSDCDYWSVLNDGYRDGYLDGVADTENKYAAESETASDPRDYEAEREGQAGEDWAERAGQSVSEVLGRIARWYTGLDTRV